MKPPGRTTLNRMLLTAMRAQAEIEGSEQARILAGMQTQPDAQRLERRDDFAGFVRLIDVIQSDRQVFDRLQQLMARRKEMTIDDLATVLDDGEVKAE